MEEMCYDVLRGEVTELQHKAHMEFIRVEESL